MWVFNLCFGNWKLKKKKKKTGPHFYRDTLARADVTDDTFLEIK